LDTAVIMARGLGTRMRNAAGDASLSVAEDRVASTGVKALIPIDRPFLDYVLSNLADAGYRRICLVIGPEHVELRRYYGEEVTYQRLQVSFAVQEQPRGTADAVAAAEKVVGSEPFLVINSDNYYPVEALRQLRALTGPGLAVFSREAMLRVSNIDEQRLTKFAVVETDGLGNMMRVIEKPQPDILEKLAEPVGLSMNCWRFHEEIFSACGQIRPSPRGELEITDAVQYVIDKMGARFRVLYCDEAVLDMSSRDDVASVRDHLAGTPVHL
jgi:dTDP-glucose pyrophosphorylase